MQHTLYQRRDRQLDGMALPQRERRAGRQHAFGHHLHPGQNLRKRTAALVVQDAVADTAVPVLKESYEGVKDHFA